MRKLGRPPKELILIETDDGCIVPSSHALNQDGYFRKRVNGKLVMYHRHVYEKEIGTIPKGFEVDHVCKNRACCNSEHLQVLPSSEHRKKDNTGRYDHKREEASSLVKENPDKSMSWISRQIGVSFSSVCRWKREGKI